MYTDAPVTSTTFGYVIFFKTSAFSYSGVEVVNLPPTVLEATLVTKEFKDKVDAPPPDNNTDDDGDSDDEEEHDHDKDHCHKEDGTECDSASSMAFTAAATIGALYAMAF